MIFKNLLTPQSDICDCNCQDVESKQTWNETSEGSFSYLSPMQRSHRDWFGCPGMIAATDACRFTDTLAHINDVDRPWSWVSSILWLQTLTPATATVRVWSHDKLENGTSEESFLALHLVHTSHRNWFGQPLCVNRNQNLQKKKHKRKHRAIVIHWTWASSILWFQTLTPATATVRVWNHDKLENGTSAESFSPLHPTRTSHRNWFGCLGLIAANRSCRYKHTWIH